MRTLADRTSVPESRSDSLQAVTWANASMAVAAKENQEPGLEAVGMGMAGREPSNPGASPRQAIVLQPRDLGRPASEI